MSFDGAEAVQQQHLGLGEGVAHGGVHSRRYSAFTSSATPDSASSQRHANRKWRSFR